MDKTILAIIGVTVLILGGAILAAQNSASTTPTAASDDPTRPIAVVSEQQFDFGKVAMNDEPMRAVTIRNDGQSPLTLSDVSTSCDCTFATVELPDKTQSPEFSMHTSSRWQGTLQAGETATLTVVYRPAVMPVTGKVTRAVSLRTNDPNKPSIQIAFEAEVSQ